MKRNFGTILATMALIAGFTVPALAGKGDTFASWGSDPQKVSKKV